MDERVFRPGRKNPLPLRPGSKELLFLQKLRDEVHRFVIGRQRQARKKIGMKSEIMSIPGVGPKTARLLWDRFSTLEGIRAASIKDLQSVPGFGPAKARTVHQALHSDGAH